MINPLITIGITCYNAQETIETAINSALAQDWLNKEIIIVDDRSDDRSREIIKAIAEKNNNITCCFQNENMGVANARNIIISKASGDLIAFFDDDDESAVNRISIQFEAIQSAQEKIFEQSFIICHTGRNQYYPDGTCRYEPVMGGGRKTALSGEDVVTRILKGKPVENIFGSAPTCSQMAHTKTYRDLGGFDITFKRSEDTEFNVRLARAGGYFIGIEQPLVSQKMTLTSDKNLSVELECALRMLKKHQDFFENSADYKFVRKWTTAKYDLIRGDKLQFIKKIISLAFTNPVYLMQRIVWALPNICFNLKFWQFHNGK